MFGYGKRSHVHRGRARRTLGHHAGTTLGRGTLGKLAVMHRARRAKKITLSKKYRGQLPRSSSPIPKNYIGSHD